MNATIKFKGSMTMLRRRIVLKERKSRRWPSWSVLVTALALFCSAPLALADTEPNNTCESANGMGVVELPSTFSGELTQSDTAGDVDFYRFQATPGATIQVDLQGSSLGNGTLYDPLLGFFDSSCNLVGYSDNYSYWTLDSRLPVTVPDDGSFILAATACCDISFEGVHSDSGTYLVTLSPFAAIGSISGRVVDAANNPLDAWVELYACDDPADPGTCWMYQGYVSAGDGTYNFTANYDGFPLGVGSYLVRASDVFGYEGTSEQFSVGEGEHYAVSDIVINVGEPTIGGITGNVVDDATGSPIYAYVELDACDDPADSNTCQNRVSWGYWWDGNYFFNTDYTTGRPLTVGSYRVRAHDSIGYEGASEQFSVGALEEYLVPDIRITVPPPPTIGSISGRVVDARTGVGLSGLDYPNAWVELERCDGECYQVWWNMAADSDGNFRFVPDWWWEGSIIAGEYRVVAHATDYLTTVRDVGMVGEGEDVDIGDFPVEPYPIDLSVASPCEDLPATGGTCRYQLRITNRSLKQIKGAAWSVVDGPTGSLTGYTQFQTAPPTSIVLMPGTSRLLRFEFTVPPTVPDGPDGGYICSVTRFGQGLTQPFFNTLDESGFCVEKLPTGFTAMSKEQVLEIMEQRKALPETAKTPPQR